MRVSTGQIYDTGTLGIQKNQSSMLQSYNQISSGKRIVTPADDPVAASQALVVTQSQVVNTVYIDNQGKAQDQLSLIDTRLNDATNAIQSIISSTIQAGNPSLNDANRQALAKQLQVGLQDLLGIANTQDGTGKYMFAGYQSNQRPFATGTTPPTNPAGSSYGSVAPAVSYVTYQGDQGSRTLQVDASRVMTTNVSGSDVFMNVRDRNGTPTGHSVFDSIQNVIDLLNTPIASNPNFQTDYQRSLNEVNASLDNVLRVRSTVGAQMSELSSLGTASSAADQQYQTTLSNMQDLDYASALTNYTKQQTALQASQLSFMKITSLNLFNNL